MKPNLLSLVQLATPLIPLLGILTLAPRAQAESPKFFCAMSIDGEGPATFVHTDRYGNLELIRWQDNDFPPPYTPQRRCEEVSSRFQKFYENGTLDYVRTSLLKGQPILCVAASKGGSCLPNGVLLTLKPGSDPRIILEQMKDSQTLATGNRIYLNAEDGISVVEGQTYLDFKVFSRDTKAVPPLEVSPEPIWKQ